MGAKPKLPIWIDCSIVKITDALRTQFNNKFRPLYSLRSKKKMYRVVSQLNFHMIGLKYLHCVSFIVPFYNIYCCLRRNHYHFISRLKIRCLMSPYGRQSETYCVRFSAKWQENSNVKIVLIPWYDPLNGQFVD